MRRWMLAVLMLMACGGSEYNCRRLEGEPPDALVECFGEPALREKEGNVQLWRWREPSQACRAVVLDDLVNFVGPSGCLDPM